jgi:hypothetical protein
MMLLTAGVFALVSCSSADDDDDAGSNAPDYKTVFETLPPPTPNKLRGVWLSKTTAENGTTTDLHLKFTDGFLVGGTRCLPKDKSRSVTTGGSAKLETTALESAMGRFTTANLSFSTRDGDLTCGTTLAGNTYDFSITDRKLTLSVTNSGSSSTFEKIGD